MTVIDVRVAVAASVVTCAIGAACGYILTKKHVSDQYELLIAEEVEKAKAYYTIRPPVEKDIPETEVVVEEIETTEVAETTEEQNKLKADFVQYSKIATNYGARDIPTSTLVKPNDGESMEDFEQRLIDEAKGFVKRTLNETATGDEETLDEEVEIVTTNIFDNHGPSDDHELDLRNQGTDIPYIISNEMFEDSELEYNQNTLTYYEDDNVLVDEKDQPLQLDRTIGHGNLLFGKGSGDVNIVYIRNEKLEVDFEICRSYGSYAEEVLGVSGRKNKGQS